MEIVYLDDATSKMLLSKDTNRPVCDKEIFAFDETGLMHILYKNNEGETIRDFIIPSDREPEETSKDLIDKLEVSKEKANKRRLLKIAAGISIAVSLLLITFAVMIWLK